MTTTTRMQQLGLDGLSVVEKITLIGELWDSLGDESFPLTDEQEAELERRIELYKADPKRGSPWPEVMARIRASR
jgi:putative addiction module component (TIGR02574 family)